MNRARPNPWILAAGIVLFLPLLVLLGISFGRDPRAVPSMLEQQTAPNFTLVDLEGKNWSLNDLRGEPIVLNFWSTWCGPCKQEHQLLLDAHARWPGVRFLGVIYEDVPSKAREYLARAGASYPHLVDPSGTTAIEYGVAGVPESFVIDREGKVIHKQVGPFDAASLENLVALLEGGP